MVIPKLVCEVSDASGFAWFVDVDSGLNCKQHDLDAELRVESDFGASPLRLCSFRPAKFFNLLKTRSTAALFL
jgi:hypothetical protein